MLSAVLRRLHMVNANDIQASSSLSAFRQRLKTFLFRQSFPDIVL